MWCVAKKEFGGASIGVLHLVLGKYSINVKVRGLMETVAEGKEEWGPVNTHHIQLADAGQDSRT